MHIGIWDLGYGKDSRSTKGKGRVPRAEYVHFSFWWVNKAFNVLLGKLKMPINNLGMKKNYNYWDEEIQM